MTLSLWLNRVNARLSTKRMKNIFPLIGFHDPWKLSTCDVILTSYSGHFASTLGRSSIIATWPHCSVNRRKEALFNRINNTFPLILINAKHCHSVLANAASWRLLLSRVNKGCSANGDKYFSISVNESVLHNIAASSYDLRSPKIFLDKLEQRYRQISFSDKPSLVWTVHQANNFDRSTSQ